MDKKEFKTEINVNWPCSPTVMSGEHAKSSILFCCPSSVKFAVAIYISDWNRLAITVKTSHKAASELTTHLNYFYNASQVC